MPKLSTSEVQAILKAEKADALGGMNASELSSQRSKAMDYFLGDMTEDMPVDSPDHSKAVSSDVADTVEGLMPPLMEIFFSGDEVAEFAAVGPEDETAAQQETDYINHVFMQKNPGFIILYSMIKDALISKMGIVKIWWEEKEEEEEEMKWGLDDASYGMLLMEEEAKKLTIVQHTERMGIVGQQPKDEEAYAA